MRYLLLLPALCALGCNSEFKDENVRLQNENVVLLAERDKHRVVAEQMYRETGRLESELANVKKQLSEANQKLTEARDTAETAQQESADEKSRTQVARDRLVKVIQDMILGNTEQIEAAIKSADSDEERAVLGDALKVTRLRSGK